MKIRSATLAWQLLRLPVLGLLIASVPVQAEELRIGGTGAALGAVKLLAQAFGKENPAVTVHVLSSLGSSGALKALPKGALDIGLTARPLTAPEAALGLVAIEFARTPLVFAVASSSGVTALSLADLARYYDGSVANWPDGRQVRPVLRQLGDDNTRQVTEMSPGLDTAMAVAEKRAGLPFATTDQEAVEKISQIPGAFGVTTLGQINSESLPLRALVLDGIAPTTANAVAGKYAHAKHLYFVTMAEPSAAARQFIAFARGPGGRAILVRTGHWTP